MSKEHLDMVVWHPELPLQDTIVSRNHGNIQRGDDRAQNYALSEGESPGGSRTSSGDVAASGGRGQAAGYPNRGDFGEWGQRDAHPNSGSLEGRSFYPNSQDEQLSSGGQRRDYSQGGSDGRYLGSSHSGEGSTHYQRLWPPAVQRDGKSGQSSGWGVGKEGHGAREYGPQGVSFEASFHPQAQQVFKNLPVKQ